MLRAAANGDATRLTGYDEKPEIDYTTNLGVVLLCVPRLVYIEPGERLDFPNLIMRLIAAGEDDWLDIGRHDDYERAQEEFETVKARLIRRGERGGRSADPSLEYAMRAKHQGCHT